MPLRWVAERIRSYDERVFHPRSAVPKGVGTRPIAYQRESMIPPCRAKSRFVVSFTICGSALWWNSERNEAAKSMPDRGEQALVADRRFIAARQMTFLSYY
jgi:hypothetical protein